MALDLEPFLIPQFPDAPRILTNTADLANLLRRQDLADIRNEELPNPISCAHVHLAMKRDNRFSSRAGSLVWHCQTTETLHPVLRKLRKRRPSRLVFPSIFRFQNALFVCGLLALGHPLCPCQKHPCTKISFSCPVRTISGLPGIVSTLPRKRQCNRLKHFLTSRSGDVLRPLTFAMIRLRFSGGNLSVMSFLFCRQ